MPASTLMARLKVMRNKGVPEGKVLNAYGKNGNTQKGRYRLGVRVSWREKAMKRNLKRKRLVLKEVRAKALEAHELQQLARENATLAMKTLIEIAGSSRAPEANRIAASNGILDRAYGKASQTSITANVSNTKASEISGDELEKRTRAALRRIEDITNRAPKKTESPARPADVRKLN